MVRCEYSASVKVEFMDGADSITDGNPKELILTVDGPVPEGATLHVTAPEDFILQQTKIPIPEQDVSESNKQHIMVGTVAPRCPHEAEQKDATIKVVLRTSEDPNSMQLSEEVSYDVTHNVRCEYSASVKVEFKDGVDSITDGYPKELAVTVDGSVPEGAALYVMVPEVFVLEQTKIPIPEQDVSDSSEQRIMVGTNAPMCPYPDEQKDAKIKVVLRASEDPNSMQLSEEVSYDVTHNVRCQYPGG